MTSYFVTVGDDLTLPSGIIVPAASVSGLLAAIPAATTSTAGVLPLATSTEVATGTEPAKTVTPKALADSRYFVQADANGASLSLTANTWVAVPCSHKVADASGTYQGSTGYFTAPVTGDYHFETKLRIADAAASPASVGLIVDTTGSDGAYTTWGNRDTNGFRFELEHNRTLPLAAGTQVALWAFSADSTRTATNASFVAYRV